MLDSSKTFSGLKGHLYGTLQHNFTLCSTTFSGYIRLQNSESYISNQVTVSKTTYSCNDKFMLNLCTLLSENLHEGLTFLPNMT